MNISNNFFLICHYAFVLSGTYQLSNYNLIQKSMDLRQTQVRTYLSYIFVTKTNTYTADEDISRYGRKTPQGTLNPNGIKVADKGKY